MSIDERTKKRLKTSEHMRKKYGRDKTVGQIALEEMQKAPDPHITMTDYQREAQKDYIKNLEEAAKLHEKIYQGDFYIVVTTKRETLMNNVIRNIFTARKSCPTPSYDQSVFLYHRNAGFLEYLWTVPNKFSCIDLLQRRLEIGNNEKELLEMVIRFGRGELLKLCKQLNNENDAIPDLII